MLYELIPTLVVWLVGNEGLIVVGLVLVKKLLSVLWLEVF